MATETRDVDVVVIGAGLAGLTAAYRLLTLDPKCKVLVIEAKDRVGGRTYTVDLKAAKGTDKWDLGGQWVCRTQHHILWLLEEFGIKTYEQEKGGRHLFQIGSDKIREKEPKFGIFSLLDMGLSGNKIQKMAKQVPREDPRKCPKADQWDSMTVASLVDSVSWTKESKDFVEFALEGGLGIRMREQSALHLLFLASSSGTLPGGEEGRGAEEWKVTGGVQQASELLTERIGKDNVILSEPVKMIDQSDKDKVVVTTESGKNFACRYVINSSPLHCSVEMDYKPKFPQIRESFARRSPMGNLFKFLVTYNTAFWQEKGYSGDLYSRNSSGAGENKPISVVVDSTTADDNPALVGFYAKPWFWRTVEFSERREAVLKHLSEFLGPEATNPLDFTDKDWSAEPFSGGCPCSFTTTGAITTFYDGVRTPFDRVHWAGTESATNWLGYLDGAVQSGMRAADEVLSRINPDFKGDGLLEELDRKVPPL